MLGLDSNGDSKLCVESCFSWGVEFVSVSIEESCFVESCEVESGAESFVVSFESCGFKSDSFVKFIISSILSCSCCFTSNRTICGDMIITISWVSLIFFL